ncbi:hypothetical protein [Lacrimispora amygdalina]|uniref:hypothetical protein n=1 Tax=Lacrimispora amygdalina TaxID=253257 RepID=UPI000BE3343B|nr:hypothetical protein [Lacrimispora amygdalina]
MYDIDKIIDEASPLSIAKYLGIPMKKSGNTIFIKCPVHERETGSIDRHINNCVLRKTFKKAFFCHSCHGSGSGFDLIAGYLNLDIKKDFVQILKIAAESCGGEEFFIISDSKYNLIKSKKENQEIFGVLAEDLKKLGLLSNIFSKNYKASYDESQLSDFYDVIKESNFDVYNENQLPKVTALEIETSNKLFSSLNREVYYDIIKEKAKEKMELYRALSVNQSLYKNQLLSIIDVNQRQSLTEELKNEFRKRYLRIENIYCKVASKEEIKSIDNSWLYDIHIEELENKKPGSLF